VPPKDPQALADAWLKLIELGPASRQRLGAEGRRRVEKQFDLRVVAARYDALYRELVNN